MGVMHQAQIRHLNLNLAIVVNRIVLADFEELSNRCSCTSTFCLSKVRLSGPVEKLGST
jgi:hypothetical protein